MDGFTAWNLNMKFYKIIYSQPEKFVKSKGLSIYIFPMSLIWVITNDTCKKKKKKNVNGFYPP